MIKFYKCLNCKNMVTFVHDSKVPVVCCGEKMTELVPNTVDASKEKHVPEVLLNGNLVSVTIGSVEHPMTVEHYIEWICLETKNGYQIKYLNPTEKPTAQFALIEGDEVVSVYEYCNLHGLWQKQF